MGFKFPRLESGHQIKLSEVVFSKDDGRFFAQNEAEDPTKLNADIKDQIDNLEKPIEGVNPKVGEAYICQFEEDDEWYRAQVIQVRPSSGSVTVEFVDYGNDEMYSKKKWAKHARQPHFSFVEHRMMCIKMCDVKISTNAMEYDYDLIEQLTMDRTNKFTFIPTHDMLDTVYDPETSVASGHIQINGKSLAEVGEKKDDEAVAVSNIIVNSATPTSSVYTAEPTVADYPIDKRDGECFVSHFGNELFLCPCDKYQARVDFDAELNAQLGNELIGEIKKFDYVAAKDENIYSRAQVIGIEGNSFVVFFCDYGNTSTVSIEQLKRLPPGMQSTRKFVFPIATNVAAHRETISKWVDQEKPLITVEHGELVIEGLEPLEYLSAHCTIPDNPGIVGSCFITRFERELLFCNDFVAREKLNANLDQFVSKQGWPLKDGHSGVACAALHDGAYYRAEIIDTIIDLNKKGEWYDLVTVRFVDHGNCATVNMAQIMHLPAQFCRDAKFAVEIKVDGLETLVAERDTIRKWEDDEEPKIEVYGSELKIDGQAIDSYFGVFPRTSNPSFNSPEAPCTGVPLPKVKYSYAQYNLGEKYEFDVVEVDDNTLMGYMKEKEAQLIHISTIMKEDIDQNFDHTAHDIRIGDNMVIYDDIFGEGDEYLRCEILAVNDGFTVKVVDYGITRKVDRVFPLDENKHKGVDWELGGLILRAESGVINEAFQTVTVKLTSKLADGDYNYVLFDGDVAVEATKSETSAMSASITEQKSDEPATCDSIEAVTAESLVAEEKITVVVTNVRAGSDGHQMTCFAETDWDVIASLKPLDQKSLPFSELNNNMHVLIQTNPINRDDCGYRRAKLKDAIDQRHFFQIDDCDKKVCAAASHVYRCDNPHGGIKPKKYTLPNNPGRDIIGRKVKLVISHHTTARLDYNTAVADKLIDQLGELAINKQLEKLTPEPLNNLIHRLQAALELF